MTDRGILDTLTSPIASIIPDIPTSTGYSDDLEAINRFILEFHETSKPPITPAARIVRNQWIEWYGGLSWWNKNMDRDVWMEGRSRRNQFRTAMGMRVDPNALTSEDVMPNGPPGAGLATAGRTVTKPLNAAILPLSIAAIVGGITVFTLTKMSLK